MKWSFLIVFCFTVFCTSAQEIIRFSDSVNLLQVTGKNLLIYEDESKDRVFKDIVNEKFVPAEFITPNFGFKNSSFWFFFKIKNTDQKVLPVMIEIKNPNLDVVSLTVITSSGDTITETSGDYFPFGNRKIMNKYFQFRYALLPGGENSYYLNVQNSGEQFHAPLYIGKPDTFVKIDSDEQIIFGIYFGIILFVIALNLFFYIVLRDNSTFYYIGYLIGLLFLQLSLTGIGFMYLWPDSVYLANHANPVFANFSIWFLLIFSLKFLKIDEYMPKMAKIYRWLSYVVISGFVAALIPVHACYIYGVLSINVIALILNICIIPTSVIIYKRKYKPARFFAVAFVVLIISVFLFVFKNFGILPPGFLTEFGLQIGSALEVLLLTLAVIDRFRQFKDEALNNLEEVNRLKTDANIQLEKKVIERTAELAHQKHIVEEKQKEIIDSINYAQRLQQAILAPKSEIDKVFANHFLLYRPKDIVAGDFYFFEKTETHIFYAAADCTGHGVPGAMVSIVCSNALTRCVKEFELTDPGKILDKTRDLILETFQKSGEDVKDGMDISLLSISLSPSSSIQWSGAHNPLWYIENGELKEIKADKQPIGKTDNPKPFSTHSLSFLSPGSSIFLFTDGYADQFGGPKGKKFKYSTLSNLLLEIHTENPQNQFIRLTEEFELWKGNLEQVDDVCIIGIRL